MQHDESEREPVHGEHTGEHADVSRHAGRYVGRDVDEAPEAPAEQDVGAYTDADVGPGVRERAGEEGEYEDSDVPGSERPARAQGHYTDVGSDTDADDRR